jgi:hypothetical protein
MSVLGYQEARATALEIKLPEGQRISTVSLPMLAVMKVVAWADRHVAQPRKDASDLVLILRTYLHEKNAARLYDEAAHLLEAEDFDFEAAAAWLTGFDAAASVASETMASLSGDAAEPGSRPRHSPGLSLEPRSRAILALTMIANGCRSTNSTISIGPTSEFTPARTYSGNPAASRLSRV